MEIRLEKIFERDVDLAVANCFSRNQVFVNYFLKKINLKDYAVSKIEHSYMDQDGESDLTIILRNGEQRIALLIEDKIDAIAMPNQRDRYDIRGNTGIKNDKYDQFYVFIIAPNDYLTTNIEAQKYPNRISYEEMISAFPDNEFLNAILNKALEEKKQGYVVIENKAITLFWKQYYDYIDKYFPNIKINKVEGPRGNKANWVLFPTGKKNIQIVQKSDRGFLDLELPKMGEHYSLVDKFFGEYLDNNMRIEKASKSMAIRIVVPVIDFTSRFEENIDKVNLTLQNVEILLNLFNKVDITRMYIELEKVAK